MKIYTKTGDEGDTGLLGGSRVPKSHARVEACGALDELGAFVGGARTRAAVPVSGERLERVQHDLFTLGAELAAPDPGEGRKRPQTPDLPAGRVAEMEQWIDEVLERIPARDEFVLSGGSPGAVAMDLARTVCRRAERAVVALDREASVDPVVLRYLNRLSDVLFAFARLENLEAGTDDVIWKKEGSE